MVTATCRGGQSLQLCNNAVYEFMDFQQQSQQIAKHTSKIN